MGINCLAFYAIDFFRGLFHLIEFLLMWNIWFLENLFLATPQLSCTNIHSKSASDLDDAYRNRCRNSQICPVGRVHRLHGPLSLHVTSSQLCCLWMKESTRLCFHLICPSDTWGLLLVGSLSCNSHPSVSNMAVPCGMSLQPKLESAKLVANVKLESVSTILLLQLFPVTTVYVMAMSAQNG